MTDYKEVSEAIAVLTPMLKDFPHNRGNILLNICKQHLQTLAPPEPAEFNWCAKPPILMVKDAAEDDWNFREFVSTLAVGVTAEHLDFIKDWNIYQLAPGVVYHHNGNGQNPCPGSPVVIRGSDGSFNSDYINWGIPHQFYIPQEWEDE